MVELEQIYERESKQSAVTGHRMAGVAGAKKMQVAVGELGKAGRCRGFRRCRQTWGSSGFRAWQSSRRRA